MLNITLKMSRLKAVIAILAVSFCSSLVYSERPIILSKGYNFGNKHVIVGKNNINDTAFVYAVCKGICLNRTVTCVLNFESDVFDDSKPKPFCNFTLETEILNGKLEILEINLWGRDKAIFVWRDINNNNLRHTEVTINVVKLDNCNLNVHKIKVHNRYDQKPQVFITPYENSYDIVFMDIDRCGNMFCKKTVSLSGAASEPVGWFPNTGLVSALERNHDDSNKLVITNYKQRGRRGDVLLKAYLLNDTKYNELMGFGEDIKIGWSAENGFISLCSYRNCFMYNTDGSSVRMQTLSLLYCPVAYSILYNTPNDSHLALVCTNDPNGNYSIVRMSEVGLLLHVHYIEELKCAHQPKVLTGKFLTKSNGEYCLSLFFSVNNNAGEYKFNKYCFSALDAPWSNYTDEISSM